MSTSTLTRLALAAGLVTGLTLAAALPALAEEPVPGVPAAEPNAVPLPPTAPAQASPAPQVPVDENTDQSPLEPPAGLGAGRGGGCQHRKMVPTV